ncbi:MAG: quinolinate synthase NadA [Spirochaetes bacterium]|nr:quinolinate synthase NadA [Spirochaetota bacterium]
MDIIEKIREIASQKNAVILAHNYQPEEIQKAAHHTGDSLELSRIAAESDADIIVFCGVYFMAESAYILSPQKKIIIPEPDAGCPMADMADPERINEFRAKYPGAKVVCYINSTAAAKAVSDVCCTSSNAVKIISSIDADRIIFIPDKNLGSYVAESTDKEIILWDGYCPIHNARSVDELLAAKSEHGDAEVLMHPECPKELRDLADRILSTGEMVSYCRDNKGKKFIIATENGMIYKLKSEAPENEYIQVTTDFICPDMKKITLEKLYNSLINEEPSVTVDPEIADKAYSSLDKMLKMS